MLHLPWHTFFYLVTDNCMQLHHLSKSCKTANLVVSFFPFFYSPLLILSLHFLKNKLKYRMDKTRDVTTVFKTILNVDHLHIPSLLLQILPNALSTVLLYTKTFQTSPLEKIQLKGVSALVQLNRLFI